MAEPKVVLTMPGDSVGRLLYRYFKRDDDKLEAAFFELNPKLANVGVTFNAGIEVRLPVLPEVQVERVVTAWD